MIFACFCLIDRGELFLCAQTCFSMLHPVPYRCHAGITPASCRYLSLGLGGSYRCNAGFAGLLHWFLTNCPFCNRYLIRKRYLLKSRFLAEKQAIHVGCPTDLEITGSHSLVFFKNIQGRIKRVKNQEIKGDFS